MRFKGKVALITAAASGIGRATANIIGSEGGRIAAVDTDRARLDQTVAEIEAAGGEAHAYNVDALDERRVDSTVTDAAKRFGRIDILVNAVGGSTIIANPAATTDTLTLAEWQSLFHFNLTGTFLFTHAVIPVMKQQRSGKIVNLASIAGRGKSSASSSAYATAKGGIIALTTKLANELGPYGINVNAIAPATTLTERIRPRWEQRPPEARQADIDRTPLRRMGEAVDQANVICFLCAFITRRFRHRPHHRRDGRALRACGSNKGERNDRLRAHSRCLPGRLDLEVRVRAPARQGPTTFWRVTLDGCGERASQIGAGITTETHGEEIAKLLYFHDLKDAVLVGTSSGGMAMACAAEQARERIARVVFADAFGAPRRREDPRHRQASDHCGRHARGARTETARMP